MPKWLQSVCAFAFALLFVLPAPSYAICAAPRDMNGVWRANDGGTYYVRQLGNEVWWLGMSPDDGRTWTNVFHGTRNGNTVTGTWADVPKGRVAGGGMMTLTVHGVNGVTGFTRAAVSGGFGGSRWSQPCNDN